MQFQNLLTYLSYPIKAVVSRSFYIDVMFRMKGVGLVYLLILCAALALPACLQVKEVLTKFKALDLPSVVAQIPASTISPQGVLEPINPNDTAPLVIRNTRGEAVMFYNLENVEVKGVTEQPPITITSHAAIIRTGEGSINVPWTSIYGNNGAQFEPLEAAGVLEQAFSASYFSIWVVVTLWFLSSLAFVVLVAASLTKVFSLMIAKTKVNFVLALRVNAFATTLIGFFTLAQFYVNFSLSFIVMCMVPIVYTMSVLSMVRRDIVRALKDPYFALSKKNPFLIWFDYQSRLLPNNTLDRGPEFEALTVEQQQERIENLKRNTARGIDLTTAVPDVNFFAQKTAKAEYGNHQSREERPFDNQEQQNNQGPYSFDENAGLDDPIFKEPSQSNEKAGSVRSGNKGEDSSFTP